jgi:hypothetical protein
VNVPKKKARLWNVGRPVPVLHLTLDGPEPAEKPLAAILGDYAGRVLAATPPEERWTVIVAKWTETTGVVLLDLALGTKGEVRAAMALLEGLAT